MTEAARKKRMSGGAWILEQFTQDNPIHERNASRRVLSEVMRAWPGDPHRLWWKWMSESASSMGLRTKTMDCSLEEAATLAKDGAQFIVYDESNGPRWFAILGKSGKRWRTISTEGEEHTQASLSLRRVRSRLKDLGTDGQVRCVVVLTSENQVASQDPARKLSPLRRLQKLLLPEWYDIWLVFVFAFVVSLLMLATPIAVEALVNTVAFGRFVQPIIVLAIILLTFLGFQGAIRAIQTYVVEIIQRRLFARVAGDLAFRLPRAHIEATDREYLPELTNRFFDIVTVQKVSAQLLLDGIGIVLATVIGMAVLGFYHPWLLGFDVILLASIAFIIVVLGRGAITSAVKESKNKYYMASWLEDVARCPTTFRSEGGSEFAMERADRLIHEYLSARKSHFQVLMRQILFALGLQAVASTLLLGLGGWLVVSGELTLGQLVAAELIVTYIVGSFAKFGKHMESFYDLLASVDKLGVLFDLPTEREDGMLGIHHDQPLGVELHEAAYKWPEGQGGLLPTSAMIPAGISVAVYGESGSGKSTLCDLLYGIRHTKSGHVRVDGFDPQDLRPDILRSRVSLARGPEIFHATIEENVHLHREDISAGDVMKVLGQVGLMDAIMKLDGGYDTMLTSGGAPLSENQQRLLAIARAAIGSPGVLVVDGVLDSLSDSELEPVLSFLLAPGQPWTLIIATGREEIARRCTQRIDLRAPDRVN